MEAVEQRPEGVKRNGAATCFDEYLGRHSGNNMNSALGDQWILHANFRA